MGQTFSPSDPVVTIAALDSEIVDSFHTVGAAMDLEDLDEGSDFRVTVCTMKAGTLRWSDQVNTDVVRRRMIEAVSTHSSQSGPR